jgi:2-furoyl-CoA dehydrogenase FAD binding subunit
MKPAAFDYIRADSIEEAVALLKQYGEDAKILAGGQSLLAMLNIRLAQPKVLIDISRCAPLKYLRAENGYLIVGAAVTQAELQWRAGLAQEVPLLHLALPWISHFQVRNRGTVCGSLAQADPSAELPLCLTALQGEVVLRSSAGRRVIKATDFFQGMLTTDIRPGELIEEARFPLQDPVARYAFEEVSIRHGDFAIVALAGVVTDSSLELTVGGVADRPQRLVMQRIKGAELISALNDFAWTLDAQTDMHASASYRRHLVRGLGQQLLSGLQL